MTAPNLCALRPWTWLIAACAVLCAPVALVAADQKQVLVLYSTRRDAQIAVVGDRELPNILEAGLQQGLDYYSEYLDRGRFPSDGYYATFRDFIRLKYGTTRFDIVIAIQTTAIELVERMRQELFANTPLIFVTSDPATGRARNSTGVVVQQDLSGTIVLAAELQPDLRHVFFVSGASSADRAYEARARSEFGRFEPKLTATYLSGLTTSELEARVARLPDHSFVYYLLAYQDGAGENVHPLEYIDRIIAAANRPTYSWVDSAMARGIVGGYLLDQKAQMEAVGTLALRVLNGEPADDIPIATPELHARQVDWRQLQRWGIAEARVPPGTLVRFREPGIWQRYKTYIVGALAILLTQTALIGALLVQAVKRRQAEALARGSQAELRTSDDRIRDLGGRLLRAQEAERSRIARELHDDISQQIALMAIDIESARGQGDPRSSEAARLACEALNRLEGISRSVYDLSQRLHPTKLELVGLVPSLGGLRRDLSRPDLTIEFSHDNVPPALPQELTLCLYRIGQEALGNAVKHSGAREVVMHLRGDRDRLTLTIADDGTGFDVNTAWGRGLGLISMRERLDALGGTFDLHAGKGKGTRLKVSVPILHSLRPSQSVSSSGIGTA